VTVHYTGAKAKPENNISGKLRSLYNFSTRQRTKFKRNLWTDVPYHYYLDAKGLVAGGRDTRYQPDSNTKYDTDGHISIVVEGNDKDHISAEQQEKLKRMLDAAVIQYNIKSISQIGVHSDFASTTCPGPELRALVEAYKRSRSDLQPGVLQTAKDVLPVGQKNYLCPMAKPSAPAKGIE